MDGLLNTKVDGVHICCGFGLGFLGAASLIGSNGVWWQLLGLGTGCLSYVTFLFWYVFLTEGPCRIGIGRRCLWFGATMGVMAVIGGHYPGAMLVLFLVLVVKWTALCIALRLK